MAMEHAEARLWLLRPVEGAQEWEPWYDKAFGFVVRAATEDDARAMIATTGFGGECGDECVRHYDQDDFPECVWRDPAKTTCVLLTGEGENGIIMRDFAAA